MVLAGQHIRTLPRLESPPILLYHGPHGRSSRRRCI